VVPIAVGMKWFPDKKGLISGLAVAGFGFGATLWMALAGKLGALGGGELIKHIGMSNTFIVLGIIFFVIYVIAAVLFPLIMLLIAAGIVLLATWLIHLLLGLIVLIAAKKEKENKDEKEKK